MLKHYFKVSLRNLWKNKILSCINIFGLIIGLSSCLLIAIYIQHELSYDKFETKRDRIARVIMEYSFNGSSESNKGNFTSVRVAAVFKRVFPEVETAIKMTKRESIVRHKDRLIAEKNFMYADPDFFHTFSFDLLQGNPEKVIAEPRQVVLTESTAKRYFGSENPVGKTLQVNNDSALYIITGVMKDCPSNSQIKFDFLASFSSLGITKEYEDSYWDANYTTYLLLKDKKSIASLQAKLPAFMKKEMAGQGATVNFFLEPFSTIHLHSPYDGFEPNNNIVYIYILAAVALLILIIACSTYINLSTARSIERAKEVGVRKVIGAEKKQLFWQFIGESFLICLVSILISMIAVVFLMPSFNQLTGKQLSAGTLFSWPIITMSIFFVICISLLAGSYPALVLTGFQPVKVLKGSFKNTSGGRNVRKSLIVFQFVISVFLIITTLIVQEQLYYIQHKNVGYNREQVLVMPMGYEDLNKLPALKTELKSNPDVMSISRCSWSPVEINSGFNMRSSTMPSNEQIAVRGNVIDEDFIKTTGLQLIAGSDFTSQDIKDVEVNDQNKKLYHFILNESAAKQLGWSAKDAVGKKMFLDDSRPGFVKGVVKDFHFQSLHSPIRSLVMFPEGWSREVLVKLSGHNLRQTISFIESKWKTLVPNRPFEYHFLDEDFNNLYNSELRLGKIMNRFATIAIILACLGLFGLSSYAAQQRMKEVGIRKVLGASVSNIVVTLSGDFLKLAGIAIIIAAPVAWLAMYKWLQDFAYRINMDWGVYLLAGAITLLLAVITVSFHAIKAAVNNPVKSLRTE